MSDARDIAERAREFLAAVERGEDDERYRSALATLDESALATLGDDEPAAKAFWLNCYNALAQVLLREEPSLYDDKRRFFGTPALTVAGTALSLDDIEHGILRSSKWKYGLGYVPRLFVGDFERKHRLDDVDPRIHFALNCGAASCPAVRAYTAESVDEQLETATRSFLEQSTTRDREAGDVTVTRLLLYYRGDFGGRSGIYEFLERYGVIEAGERPRVRYGDYDWTRKAGTSRPGED